MHRQMDGQMKGRMDRHGLLYSCLVASVKGYLEDIDFQSDCAEFQGIFFSLVLLLLSAKIYSAATLHVQKGQKTGMAREIRMSKS